MQLNHLWFMHQTCLHLLSVPWPQVQASYLECSEGARRLPRAANHFLSTLTECLDEALLSIAVSSVKNSADVEAIVAVLCSVTAERMRQR